MLKTAQIGNHVFYKRDPLAQARPAAAGKMRRRTQVEEVSVLGTHQRHARRAYRVR
jgi:hypothetical protein